MNGTVAQTSCGADYVRWWYINGDCVGKQPNPSVPSEPKPLIAFIPEIGLLLAPAFNKIS